MKMLLLPMIWVLIGAAMIWNKKTPRSALVMAGAMIGAAAMIVLELYMPLFMHSTFTAMQWLNFVGLGWFIFMVGGFTIGLIWVLQRW